MDTKERQELRQKDHDLIIEMHTDMKYLVKYIKNNKKKIVALEKENGDRKDWQDNWDSKYKLAIGIATAIGGFIVFLTDAIIKYVSLKKGV